MPCEKDRFALNLKKLRKEKALSQKKLAEILGYSPKSVSKWESGAALPPSELLPDLARALGTDANGLFSFRGEPEYFLGIDGGGTKTAFLLTDARGETVKTLALGACNPASSGIGAALEILLGGFGEVTSGIDPGKVSVHAGIAGISVGNSAQEIKSAFEMAGAARVSVSNDAKNIVSAGLGDGNGIVAILGTGSVIIARRNKERQIGGYGHLIDDALSGSEIGRACLEAVLAEIDGWGEPTSLTRRTGRDGKALIKRLYAEGKKFAATLAPAVFECAAEGDAKAKEILSDNVRRFAAQLSGALKDFRGCEEPVKVILAGGITKDADFFLPELKERIVSPAPYEISLLDSKPVIGAVKLAGGTIKNKGEQIQ